MEVCLTESQKIKKTLLSTTVAELFFKTSFGSCQFLSRTDAKNLVTTARTNLLPERRDHPHDFKFAKGNLFRNYS